MAYTNLQKVRLGKRLADFRKARGYTQARVAEVAGVTQGYVAQWESGYSAPSNVALNKLARLYRVKADVLRNGETKVTRLAA